MSKAVSTDHAFDLEKYTELLIKAQGGRSQTEFASDCGVSVAYMCKYLNKRFDKAPTPTTIKKIAASAANAVSLSELLNAAGYDASKYTSTEQNISSINHDNKKLALATITNCLASCRFKWVATGKQSSFFDFSIDVIDGAISSWNFIFLDNTVSAIPSTPFQNRMESYYGKLVTTNINKNTKFSFVTTDSDLFHLLQHIPPYFLNAYVSVILIDISRMEIIDEKFLDSALSLEQKPFFLF